MQRLGQHFLKNNSVTEKMIDALAIQDGDLILEIGPGHGELTKPLLQAVERLDCTLIAIEKDHLLFENLISHFKKSARFQIQEGDALKLLPTLIKKEYKLVGNIPYYITGKLLRTIGELTPGPERSVLMIQREVAERICAVAPKMNRLAASVQYWADASIIAFVPKSDFSPPPEVDSAVILLSAKKSALPADAERYYKAVRAIFAQPRKTILNNISTARKDSEKKKAVGLELEALEIKPNLRPQNLSIEEIYILAKAFF